MLQVHLTNMFIPRAVFISCFHSVPQKSFKNASYSICSSCATDSIIIGLKNIIRINI